MCGIEFGDPTFMQLTTYVPIAEPRHLELVHKNCALISDKPFNGATYLYPIITMLEDAGLWDACMLAH